MVLLVFFAMAYGVFQTLVIASPTRTIPWRFALLAFFVGISASAGLALFAQRGCLLLLSSVLNIPVGTLVKSDAYLQDPLIEEIAKPLPLLALMALSRVRKSLTCADAVLLCAALGSGFGFTEAALTVGGNFTDSSWSGGYWRTLMIMTSLAVPGPVTTLTSRPLYSTMARCAWP